MSINTTQYYDSLRVKANSFPDNQSSSNKQSKRKSIAKTVNDLASNLLKRATPKNHLGFLKSKRSTDLTDPMRNFYIRDQNYKKQMKERLNTCRNDIKNAAKEMKEKRRNKN